MFREDYKTEMTFDFRKQFNISIYDVGNAVTYDEAFDLLVSLLKSSETHLGAKYRNLEPLSTEGLLLIALQHAVIDSIQVSKNKQKAKQKAKIPFPKPKVKKKKRSQEEAENKFKGFGGAVSGTNI